MIKVYAPQTKILEGGTKDDIRIFEALFNGVSTRFGLRTIEKSIENPDVIFCSAFQNLRLGSINFPNILTTIRGSEFKGIREKAGLSKMGGELPTAGML